MTIKTTIRGMSTPCVLPDPSLVRTVNFKPVDGGVVIESVACVTSVYSDRVLSGNSGRLAAPWMLLYIAFSPPVFACPGRCRR